MGSTLLAMAVFIVRLMRYRVRRYLRRHLLRLPPAPRMVEARCWRINRVLILQLYTQPAVNPLPARSVTQVPAPCAGRSMAALPGQRNLVAAADSAAARASITLS